MAAMLKVEIGFDGGQVLPIRVVEDQLTLLKSGITQGAGLQEVETEDGTIALNVSKVAFVRILSKESKVGF